MTKERQVEIYKAIKGEVVFNVDAEHETIWATQAQIAELFDVNQPAIAKHIKNIFSSGELDKERVYSKMEYTATDGKKYKVNMYNLDAIISVGYRVNSKKATDFRIWATKTLHRYVVDGVAVNERRLEQLDSKKLKNVEKMMGMVSRLITRQELGAGEANGVLEVISKYAGSFQMLKEYDDGFIDLSDVNDLEKAENGTLRKKVAASGGDKKAGGKKRTQRQLTADMCGEMIDELRKSVNGGELFGKKRNDSFDGVLSAVYQSFEGKELYPSIAEKAANLLYFVIKDHPFYDGNKRIGSLLFIMFLTTNDYHLTENGETKISDRALTALALLVAESNPNEKELVVNLTRKLLV